MSKISKRSAASRKAWRTRKRMQAERIKEQNKQTAAENAKLDWLLTAIRERSITPNADPHADWPAYMKRALPLPEFK